MFENFSKNVNKVVGAGVIATAGMVGMSQNAEAGGYTPPNQEEMSQIKMTLASLESQYKSKYGGDIKLIHSGGKINIVNNETGKTLGEIQTRTLFSDKSEADNIRSIPVFEVEKEKILGTLPYLERANLNFEVKNTLGKNPTTFEISKYGYATLKVSGATLNPKNGQLYTPDGVSRIDFTDGGNNVEVEIKGTVSEMAITACIKEINEKGSLLTRAFKVNLEGTYQFTEFPASEVIKKCR